MPPDGPLSRKFWSRMTGPGPRAKLREAAAGQVSGPHETAWRVARRSQTRRVSWTLRPLKGPNGEIQYLIVSGQDVTDQRQMEMALLSSEARYRRGGGELAWALSLPAPWRAG